MRKNMMKVALVAAVAAMAGYGVYANQTKEMMSDVMLENVEALATGEGGSPSDCAIYCTPDETCTCILKYYGADNIEHRTCPDHRGKNY